MAEHGPPYAVLAEFAEPAVMIGGAKSLRADGWSVETFSPFPLDGLEDALGFDPYRVALAMLAGGIVGLAAGFGFQIGANLDYPLDVGGRPLVAIPAFVIVALVCAILAAAVAGIGAVLLGSRLPRLHHPLFDAERFNLATDDRFFLAVLAHDDAFDAREARAALWRLQAADVTDVCERRAG